MARSRQHLEYSEEPTQAPLLRWSSVFGGVVIGGALLLLLSTLWIALAEASNVQAIADGLGWFIAGSAIVALFLGGWLAGSLSGVPGIGPGVVTGLAVWGVILLLSAMAGTPGVLTAWTSPGVELPALEPGQALWPAFWGLLIGAVTAGLGGAIGGLTTRGKAITVAGSERGSAGYRDDYRDYDDEPRSRDRRDERELHGAGLRRDDDYQDARSYDRPEPRRDPARRTVDERGYTGRERRDVEPDERSGQRAAGEPAYSEGQRRSRNDDGGERHRRT